MNGIVDNAPMFKDKYQEKSLYPDKFAELFLPPEGVIAFAEAFDKLIVSQNQLKSKLETELEGGEDIEALGNKIRIKLEDMLNEMDRGEFTLKTIMPDLYNKLPHFNFDTNAIKQFIKKSMAEILTEVKKIEFFYFYSRMTSRIMFVLSCKSWNIICIMFTILLFKNDQNVKCT